MPIKKLWDRAFAEVSWHGHVSPPSLKLGKCGWGPNFLFEALIDPLGVWTHSPPIRQNPRQCLIEILGLANPSQPLKDHEVRILTVYPGDWATRICCTLESIPLKRAAKKGYRALSYAWGDDTQPQFVVEINGVATIVRQQLFEALLYLRFINRVTPQRIWIDAICIRQTDVEEKSRQLPLMGKIYSLASDVLVWLGLETEDSQLAIRYAPTSPANKDHVFEVAMSLWSVLRRPWFSRLWVVQEVALAAHPRGPFVLIGTQSVRWEGLARLIKQTITASLELQTWRLSMETVKDPLGPKRADQIAAFDLRAAAFTNLEDMRQEVVRSKKRHDPEGTGIQLSAALGQTLSYLTTDPRDKVYGLLGIVRSDYYQLAISPNYQKRTDEIFMDATLSILTIDGDSGLYFHYPTLSRPDETAPVPSWVLDF
ncbi:heterokaryon incompatibility protein-domain-containing protein, partial [Cladorrhinum sp. PSN332]